MAINKLDVISRLQNGLTPAEVAKISDTTELVVLNIEKEAQQKGVLTVARKSMSHQARKSQRKKIANYVEQGATIEAAALKFGVALQYVKRACKEHDVLLEHADRDKKQYLTYAILAKLIEYPDRREVDVAEEFGVTRQMVNLVSSRARKSGVFVAVEKRLMKVTAGGAMKKRLAGS